MIKPGKPGLFFLENIVYVKLWQRKISFVIIDITVNDTVLITNFFDFCLNMSTIF